MKLVTPAIAVLFGMALIVGGVVTTIGQSDEDAVRETGIRVVARFDELQCKSSGGSVGRSQRTTSCTIDVEFKLPDGGTFHRRAPIPYDVAYCPDGPHFHMDTTAPVYFRRKHPEKFVYAESPCDRSPVGRLIWLLVAGLVVIGLGIGLAVYELRAARARPH